MCKSLQKNPSRDALNSNEKHVKLTWLLTWICNEALVSAKWNSIDFQVICSLDLIKNYRNKYYFLNFYFLYIYFYFLFSSNIYNTYFFTSQHFAHANLTQRFLLMFIRPTKVTSSCKIRWGPRTAKMFGGFHIGIQKVFWRLPLRLPNHDCL